MQTVPLNDETPARDEGRWPHVLLTSSEAHYAERAGELVSLYVRGYIGYGGYADELDAAARLAEGSIDLATKVQEAAFQRAVTEGQIDLTDEALLTLLNTDKHIPVPTLDDGSVLEYTEACPLVISTAAYVDDEGNELPRPSGNIIVIDGSDEVAFLTSLADAGVHGYVRG